VEAVSDSQPDNGLYIENAEQHTIRQPRLVSVAYTAVYDTGQVVVGAVAHNGDDEPLTVEFSHATGASSPL
jgi:hypothetical protein